MVPLASPSVGLGAARIAAILGGNRGSFSSSARHGSVDPGVLHPIRRAEGRRPRGALWLRPGRLDAHRRRSSRRRLLYARHDGYEGRHDAWALDAPLGRRGAATNSASGTGTTCTDNACAEKTLTTRQGLTWTSRITAFARPPSHCPESRKYRKNGHFLHSAQNPCGFEKIRAMRRRSALK